MQPAAIAALEPGGPVQVEGAGAAIQAPTSNFVPYSRLFARVGERLGRDIQLVERRTYGEINDLLIDGKLDVAFICTGAPGASTLFTHGHERSVRAVARGLVDGAAVREQVFEALSATPGITGEVRAIERSPPFGGPRWSRRRAWLLGLRDDPNSAELHHELGTAAPAQRAAVPKIPVFPRASRGIHRHRHHAR